MVAARRELLDLSLSAEDVADELLEDIFWGLLQVVVGIDPVLSCLKMASLALCNLRLRNGCRLRLSALELFSLGLETSKSFRDGFSSRLGNRIRA